MTVLNTGSTKQYSANWEDIFAKGKGKKAAAGQPSVDAGKTAKGKAAGKATSSAKASRGGKAKSAKKRK
jgi:hypothetical protein